MEKRIIRLNSPYQNLVMSIMKSDNCSYSDAKARAKYLVGMSKIYYKLEEL